MKPTTLFPSLALALTLLLAAMPAAAAYPEKPVSMIIAFTAGGSSDVQARIMQKYWDKYVKEPWVFVYKPGAGGIIGFTEIAKAAPDGYAIGGLNVPHLVLQSLAQRAAFDAESFDYIAQVVNDPQCVVVLKGSKFKSFSEILEYARKNPNKLKVGLVGPLSGHHLMFLEFCKLFPDAKLSRVFYKGAADQNAALLGGEVDLIFGNINDVMRSIEEFNVLNVAAEKRNSFLPDVPTLKEQNINLVSDIRRIFAAPKGTSPEALAFLRKTFKKICNDPDYLSDMKKAGQPAEYMDGAATAAYIRSVQEADKKLLQEAGLLK
ncbi:tripartite tricarboxylate transporter substrate binding protein [Desulfovibrio legallii]|uniref:Tripartite tricarboxylate transporter substrate binding protein n=1 Tax=Desulfovibrio legallii TaxID=571438 RepID=A0A6H3FF07_9BACT|nr:tripartite tricarboxylate transporter substrate binding protein [Desulfovibrio legallii]RHH24840.1 tripartite tricarboxylate transporter substrate binding protein [Desulfovibrio sp. AM18-2]TBH80730.1 tripartite tricarboxylate transporter substrate binding protein [Desulfovibrio legallii]